MLEVALALVVALDAALALDPALEGAGGGGDLEPASGAVLGVDCSPVVGTDGVGLVLALALVALVEDLRVFFLDGVLVEFAAALPAGCNRESMVGNLRP